MGQDDAKTLEAMGALIACTPTSEDERIQAYRGLLKVIKSTLGEENVVYLEALHTLGGVLRLASQFEEAKEVLERYLVGRMKLFGEEHKDTLSSLHNLGLFAFEGREGIGILRESFAGKREVEWEESSSYARHRDVHREYL